MGSLFSPFNYLRLTQHGKWIIDWVVPLAMVALMLWGVFTYLPNFDFHSEHGFISTMRSFVETLPGFYIAALTAVATFGRPEVMDTPVIPGDIFIKQSLANSDAPILVTRRRFLCLLFAYLCALSIFLTVLPAIAFAMKADVMAISNQMMVCWAERIYIFVYTTLLAQMLVITLWGLYYLSDRIHQSELHQ